MVVYRRKKEVGDKVTITPYQAQVLQSIPDSKWITTINIVLKNKKFREDGKISLFTNLDVVKNIRALVSQGLIEKR